MTSVTYVDASAIVKLVVPEAETASMLRWYVEAERVITSRVGVIATRRAAARYRHDPDRLRSILAMIDVFELDARVAERAAAVVPTLLRALDAIHLATALEMSNGLGAFVTYDDRLAEAARAVGLPVVRPA
ncbi:MAG: type II toxin-antitoxin system VapC family toxin [Chloroflexi bacterium]|nr:type II toxin-antitoxin system VapC family toxin [Chloroflexota bacterium]